jgi:hypothetical protein
VIGSCTSRHQILRGLIFGPMWDHECSSPAYCGKPDARNRSRRSPRSLLQLVAAHGRPMCTLCSVLCALCTVFWELFMASCLSVSHEKCFWMCGVCCGRPSHWTLARACYPWPNLCNHINTPMSLLTALQPLPKGQSTNCSSAHLTSREEWNLNRARKAARSPCLQQWTNRCGYRGAVCLDPHHHQGTRLRSRSQRGQRTTSGFMPCAGRVVCHGSPASRFDRCPAQCEMTSSVANGEPVDGSALH